MQKDYSGVVKNKIDAGLIGRGSIAFAAGDTLTTEKLSVAISVGDAVVHEDDEYLIVIDKPTEDTAGDLTITPYTQVKVDGTNERDVPITSSTVAKITGAATYKPIPVLGLFVGQGTCKIGAKFAADSGAITVYFAIYRK